jgi:cytochrome P450
MPTDAIRNYEVSKACNVADDRRTAVTTANDALSGPRLGRDFDHRSGQCVAEPLPIWKRLRAEEPVARSERHGGYYVLTRYQDVYDAARATDVSSSGSEPASPLSPSSG